MLKAGNVGPTGTRLPKPDLLLLSYTGCYTFMKWFELLREEYQCPTVFLQIPYQGDGTQSPEHARPTSRARSARPSIPALEKATGRALRRGPAAREPRPQRAPRRTTSSPSSQSAKKTPSPIDAYFGAVYYVGPIFSAFRGTEEGVAYYRALRQEVEERAARGEGPMTPAGPPRRPEVPPRRRGAAQLDALPRVLEDVRRRGGGRRRLDLLEGRRDLRLRLPPRPGRSAGHARRLLQRLLHEPATCRRASTCSRSYVRGVRGGRVPRSTRSSPATPSRRGSS